MAKINRTDQGEAITTTSWPRNKTASVETRKRDLVIRITDWTDDEDEPAYDVELYIGGVYDWNESQCFTRFSAKNKARWKIEQRAAAMEFANKQITKHLGRVRP